jgi:hypothetical protein
MSASSSTPETTPEYNKIWRGQTLFAVDLTIKPHNEELEPRAFRTPLRSSPTLRVPTAYDISLNYYYPNRLLDLVK